jgi:hypothetical protein
MFTVTTVNLAHDTRSASAGHGATELGDFSAEELSALLERFRAIDALQNHDAEPHLIIVTRAGRFIIRTSQGRLLLYNARDNTIPYVELTADEIIAQLDAPVTTVAPSADDARRPAAITPSRSIAVAILVAGLSLNGYTLYSVVYTESVNQKPPVTLLTDTTERDARVRDAVGTYATGSQPGDRAIEITADGRIKFLEVEARNRAGESTDTFRVGRHDNKLCLTTAESGVVDVLNIDTLVYFRDTYKRTNKAP